MRVKLPESARDRKRSFGGAAVSTLIHALVIGGTVVATGKFVDDGMRPAPPDEVVLIAPRDPETPAVARPPETRRIEIPTNVELPAPPTNPVIDLGTVPDHLPLTSSTIGTISDREFATLRRDSIPGSSVAAVSTEPFTEMMVEKPVRPGSNNPSPRYPSMLSAAGVEGAVFAQFVVDTTGRVEPASIRFTRSDHQLFERAVRDALLRSRYVPAEYGGHRVRQLVEQGFSFAMRR